VSARYDIAIIGAGMAGASLAYHLAPHARVVLIEGETQAGYHTTGRSAAFYAESYGGPAVQPLTLAAWNFLQHPPEGFADAPLITPRGALYVARADQRRHVDAMFAAYLKSGLVRMDAHDIASRAPMLKPGLHVDGLLDASCQDIDVAALHQGYLRGAQRGGVALALDHQVMSIERGWGRWRIITRQGDITADVVVNAAGAWADDVARLAGARPVGLVPMRRTIVVFEPAAELAYPDAPLILGIEEDYYFKPQSGRIWLSPGDETPSPACDVQPDELDVAIAVERLERASLHQVQRIEQSWAGLRTFAPDRAPVFGFDPQVKDFFWCAGQGGFGIQTAPAISALCAGLLLGKLSETDSLHYSPKRFG
jgi:D-arginine dehydrogenase